MYPGTLPTIYVFLLTDKLSIYVVWVCGVNSYLFHSLFTSSCVHVTLSGASNQANLPKSINSLESILDAKVSYGNN